MEYTISWQVWKLKSRLIFEKFFKIWDNLFLIASLYSEIFYSSVVLNFFFYMPQMDASIYHLLPSLFSDTLCPLFENTCGRPFWMFTNLFFRETTSDFSGWFEQWKNTRKSQTYQKVKKKHKNTHKITKFEIKHQIVVNSFKKIENLKNIQISFHICNLNARLRVNRVLFEYN